MTLLDELQAEFPHGSRWRLRDGAIDESRCLAFQGTAYPLVVVGWSDHEVWFMDQSKNSARIYATYLDTLERIPDPVPCPITELVTLVRRDGQDYIFHAYEGRIRYDDGGGVLARLPRLSITVHPAEPGATEGRYTWEGA